jgi:hypothetical protein
VTVGGAGRARPASPSQASATHRSHARAATRRIHWRAGKSCTSRAPPRTDRGARRTSRHWFSSLHSYRCRDDVPRITAMSSPRSASSPPRQDPCAPDRRAGSRVGQSCERTAARLTTCCGAVDRSEIDRRIDSCVSGSQGRSRTRENHTW